MKNSEKYKTAEARGKAFRRSCAVTKLTKQCEDALSCTECQFAWLDLEAEEENPLPCPYCGEECKVHSGTLGEWVSCSCGYSSKMIHGGAVAAHNLVARAVMEAEKCTS